MHSIFFKMQGLKCKYQVTSRKKSFSLHVRIRTVDNDIISLSYLSELHLRLQI